MEGKRSKFELVIWVILTLVFCQICDRLALRYLPHQINSNAVFGLALNNTVAIVVSLLITGLFSALIHKFAVTGLLVAIFIAAALSNIIDRILYHGVVDYINLFNFNLANLADILLVVSLSIIGFQAIFKQKNIST